MFWCNCYKTIGMCVRFLNYCTVACSTPPPCCGLRLYYIAASPHSSLPRTATPPPVLAFHVHQLASNLSLPKFVGFVDCNGPKNIAQFRTSCVELELFDASQLNG